MLKFIEKKILKNQKGAMDKVLVTLLLVIIAVASMIGLNSWVEKQKDALQDRSNNVIEQIQNE
ncbi:MAG: hypothetical protein U9Q04_03925 [Campylobacterota bacterium]|nr:hypothetical protein [Campylobacterota bacterium]